jgi:hypothetical protein
MRYSPVGTVIKVGSIQWMVGTIENHEARPLTKDEVEEACEILNAVDVMQIDVPTLTTPMPHDFESTLGSEFCKHCGLSVLAHG